MTETYTVNQLGPICGILAEKESFKSETGREPVPKSRESDEWLKAREVSGSCWTKKMLCKSILAE